jgi:hypothetical protein
MDTIDLKSQKTGSRGLKKQNLTCWKNATQDEEDNK